MQADNGESAPMADLVVRLMFGNDDVEVPASWLRDNCPCEACRVAATGEHRFLFHGANLWSTPKTVRHSQSTTTVQWEDHESCYDDAWWLGVKAQVQRRSPERAAWSEGFQPLQFDHATVRDDPTMDRKFLAAFLRDGAAILSDTPTEPGACEEIVRRWTPPIEVPFSLVHDVRLDPTGYNIAHTSEALPPHTDMASKRQPPSGQILHMLENKTEGGNSVLVDGMRVLSSLSERDRQILAEFEVDFRQFSRNAETWTRSPVLRLAVDGGLGQIRYSNQLLQAIDPMRTGVADWYQAYGALTNALLLPENQTEFRLDAGDLLMINNHRVLHARRAFVPTGTRHLQDIYFDADDLAAEAWRREPGV